MEVESELTKALTELWQLIVLTMDLLHIKRRAINRKEALLIEDDIESPVLELTCIRHADPPRHIRELELLDDLISLSIEEVHEALRMIPVPTGIVTACSTTKHNDGAPRRTGEGHEPLTGVGHMLLPTTLLRGPFSGASPDNEPYRNEREEGRWHKDGKEEALEEGIGSWLRLDLMMDGDIIRVKEELRRAAVAAVVILANLCGARATTLRAFQSFNMRGHPND